MPKISVIVPIYNVELYLRKCIDSILNQEFPDFELLLVDDGSTDASGIICDEYALMDARIKVFHTSNRGVSAARNLGMDQASGEWITFVDSDDWVEKEYLSCFLQSELAPKSIAYQGVILDYSACHRENMIGISYADISFDSSNIVRAISEYKILNNCLIAAKLFNREVIRQHHIRFCERISLAEDMIFVRHYLCYVEEIRLYALASYHYMQRFSKSLSNRYHSSEEQILIFKKLRELIVYLLDKYPVHNALYSNYLYTLHGPIFLIGACKEVNRKNYMNVFAYVRMHRDLFEKYYKSASLGSHIFQKILLNRILPDNMIFFFVRCSKLVATIYQKVMRSVSLTCTLHRGVEIKN